MPDFKIVYAEINFTISQQLNINPTDVSTIMIATLDPRCQSIKDNTITLDNNNTYEIVSRTRNTPTLNNPIRFTLHKKS